VFALSLWIIHGLVQYGQTAPDGDDDYPVADAVEMERESAVDR